ncbi:hypothetical protein Lalb_Chr17g0345501 [Lupinus albus]|uniref:Transmembrane protein n=1 Tax=Lupinus albus TaxID=3870 RepID=A0A6A4P8D3_LUPAL|nr:hypothetical protein Lalb_Chr17g0345501 [Lupinus albus]
MCVYINSQQCDLAPFIFLGKLISNMKFLQWLLCLALLLIHTVFAPNVLISEELKTSNPPIPVKDCGSPLKHIGTKNFGRVSDRPVSPPPKVRGSPSSNP